MAENKKRLEIRLRVKEILFDVKNKAHLTGQAREAEGTKGYEAASNMQASDDDDNIYQIKRSIANAFAALKSVLGEYLSEDKSISDNLISSEIENEGVLTLVFELPSNYNGASSDSVGSNMHAYLSDVALGEWFAITNKQDADAYIAHSAISLENAKRALYRRSRPERPTYD